jgi:hypothetical protein
MVYFNASKRKELVSDTGGAVTFQDVIIIFFFKEIIYTGIVCAVAEGMGETSCLGSL